MANRRLVLVHGFTNTPRSWDPFISALPARFDVMAVDLPGHGGAASVRLPFERAANWLGDLGGPATYVGYSMGGRLCLRLAVDRPDVVERLVLIGASPGLADPQQRDARRDADERLAASVERDGTAKFLQRWLNHPLFASLDVPPDELALRRQNSPEGLASALRLLGPGAQEPLWDRLGALRMPMMFLVGERDTKFRAIATEMSNQVFQVDEGDAWQGVTGSMMAVVPAAGHAAHLERPTECAEWVAKFVQSRSS